MKLKKETILNINSLKQNLLFLFTRPLQYNVFIKM